MSDYNYPTHHNILFPQESVCLKFGLTALNVELDKLFSLKLVHFLRKINLVAQMLSVSVLCSFYCHNLSPSPKSKSKVQSRKFKVEKV